MELLVREQFRSDIVLSDLPEDEEVVGFKMDVKGGGESHLENSRSHSALRE